jgi:hypothetical protein
MGQQRYQKEIEDILERAGEQPPEEPWHAPDEAPRRRRALPSRLRGATVRHGGFKYQYALLAGIGLIVIGAIFQWLYFFFAGLALLVAGYVMYYRAPRTSGGAPRRPQMWRGRSIEPDDPPGRRRGR